MENTFTATASLRNFRGSARKARLILDMVRGKKVTDAKNILRFSTKKMSKDILTLLNSAVANAHQIHGRVDENNLIVAEAYANEGVTMKRMILAIKGMAYHIRKRSCHITLNLDTITPPPTTDLAPKIRRQKPQSVENEDTPSVGNAFIRSASETEEEPVNEQTAETGSEPIHEETTEPPTEEPPAEPISQSAETAEEAPEEPISQPAEAAEEAPIEPISQPAEATEEAPEEPISQPAETAEEAPAEPISLPAEVAEETNNKPTEEE